MKKHIFAKSLAVAALCTSILPAAVSGAYAEDTVKEAFITKELETTDLVTVENKTFNFTVTNATYPEGGQKDTQTLSIQIGLVKNDDGDWVTDDLVTKSNDTKTYIDSVSIFEGYEWTVNGEYKFKVTENQPESGNVSGNVKTENITEGEATVAQATTVYSLAEFELTVTVADGVITSITAVQTKDDNGKTSNVKVNPDHTDGTNGIDFSNKYSKQMLDPTYGGDVTKVNGIAVQKVLGAKDPVDTTSEFIFNIYVEKPSSVSKGETLSKESGLNYTIYDANGNALLNSSFTDKQTQEVKLKAGQVLVMDEPYVGTKVTVQETNSLGYEKITQFVYNGGALTEAGNDIVNTKVSEGNDYVKVTNTKANMPATGLWVNNLPFIALIAAAGAGFIVYAASRRRKENEA